MTLYTNHLQVRLDWALVIILQVMFRPSLTAVLLTVNAERSAYQSQFGEDVVFGCRFQPKLVGPQDNLKITWHWIGSNLNREVYRMDNSVEQLEYQDVDYRGRVTLLSEALKEGWVKLQVSRLQINDSGTYQCLVQTKAGADYKTITLSVSAPYKTVDKRIQKAPDGGDLLLSCRSQGYPKSPVAWQDGQRRSVSANTTAALTPEQLFMVTSEIRVRASDRNNYTCSFTKDGHAATFHIPDEMPLPQANNGALIAIMSIGVALAFIAGAVLVYRRRKGYSAPRNLFVNGRDRSVCASPCLQVNKENEEEVTIFKEGCIEENLGALVKARYSDFPSSVDVKHHPDTVEELSLRLQNNEGHPVNLQALLPDPGETLFLEAFPENGKTSIAHILVTCWTGPALSNVLDLSSIPLLLYVDCSKAKGDLFEEVKEQLSLKDESSTDLKAMLTRSSDVLLLLDGYKEGNQFFDESLKRFLKEKRGCRVLVTACPGHWATLKDAVGTGEVLQLTNCEGRTSS